MILESIVTTRNTADAPHIVNISPMGPRILSTQENGTLSSFELRPFDTSRTFANLKRNREGVLHVDDNVELFARAAIGQLVERPETHQANKVDAEIISSACRAYEFQVKYIDETGPRMNLNCEVVAVHRMRDFFGFNRAKHAVLEAAILATRVNFLPKEEIISSVDRLRIVIEKTAGEKECLAFDLLDCFINEQFQVANSDTPKVSIQRKAMTPSEDQPSE